MKDKEHSDISKVLDGFKKSEASCVHRKDAFNIERNFEDAVKRIAKAKPKERRPK